MVTAMRGLTATEIEADRDAHGGRVAIMRNDVRDRDTPFPDVTLSRRTWVRRMFRTLQFLRLYPRAYSVDNRPARGPHSG